MTNRQKHQKLVGELLANKIDRAAYLVARDELEQAAKKRVLRRVRVGVEVWHDQQGALIVTAINASGLDFAVNKHSRPILSSVFSSVEDHCIF